MVRHGAVRYGLVKRDEAAPGWVRAAARHIVEVAHQEVR